ncbi:hypothetical protein HJB89_10935 [Rhizobium sp. NZLR8]|uniref:hypothetical protein n=1 Tax=Rhizobium sp. NZLR8 TaxID=2731104 RepID=UPI001C82E080|nr:hypothetical protein [Rhizobium sp. NZLR8]MBX5157639.1 hypothetical protein [Rhizobium sp. NZLR8]
MLQESLKASRPENMVHPEERLLPAEFREKLRKNGLVGGALPLLVSTHASYPSGYSIALPESSGGNTLCDLEAYTRDDEGARPINAYAQPAALGRNRQLEHLCLAMGAWAGPW